MLLIRMNEYLLTVDKNVFEVEVLLFSQAEFHVPGLRSFRQLYTPFGLGASSGGPGLSPGLLIARNPHRKRACELLAGPDAVYDMHFIYRVSLVQRDDYVLAVGVFGAEGPVV